MIVVSLDANVLLYAELEPETEKGRWCGSVIRAAATDGVLTVQALGEVLWVLRRRRPERSLPAVAAAYVEIFKMVPTTSRVLAVAADLCESHKFQFWDAVIWSAASDAGANLLVTEDLQEGFHHAGVEALNPFSKSGSERLKTLLPILDI